MFEHRRLAVGASLAALILAAACGSDDGPTEPPPAPGAADITQDITQNRTLYADTTYTLKGFIHVTNGATLTIQPGTTIKGDFATVGSSLFIMRGAKIDAQGTADKPIVFTSSQPVGSRSPGDWGGLIIIGNAKASRGKVQAEGTGTDAAGGSGQNYPVFYGEGSTNTDNSGTLRYVRVEFAGFAPQANAELNAFTFASVGSGTRVSYLQSLGGLDDAYEFFGGAVDADHLVAYETGDDMFDMSEGFQGRLQYLIGYNSKQLTPRPDAPGNTATDLEGIENDGCDTGAAGCASFDQEPFTMPVVANFTLVGCGSSNCVGASGGYGMMLRRGVAGYYVNGVVTRFPTAGIAIRDAATFARAGSVATPDMATTLLAVKNVYFSDLGNAPMFQPASATVFTFDAAGNSLTAGDKTGTALFTAIPAIGTSPTSTADLDWTPAANSPIATAGMATFTGKLATATATATSTGNTVAGTAYAGAAAPGGTKWWAGWTNYALK